MTMETIALYTRVVKLDNKLHKTYLMLFKIFLQLQGSRPTSHIRKLWNIATKEFEEWEFISTNLPVIEKSVLSIISTWHETRPQISKLIKVCSNVAQTNCDIGTVWSSWSVRKLMFNFDSIKHTVTRPFGMWRRQSGVDSIERCFQKWPRGHGI